jgi:hypothetical protein
LINSLIDRAGLKLFSFSEFLAFKLFSLTDTSYVLERADFI